MGAKCALISLIPISGGGGLLQSHSQEVTFREAGWIEEGKVGKEQSMAKMGSEVPRGSPPLSPQQGNILNIWKPAWLYLSVEPIWDTNPKLFI